MEWPAVHPEPFAALLLIRLGWTPAQLDSGFVALGSFAAILDADLSVWPDALKSQGAAWRRGGLNDELMATEHELTACEQAGVAVLVRGCPDYPVLLENTVRPPPLLFVRGEVTCLSLPQLAVVGSRRATRGGLDNARAFSALLAASGFAVTSGLALGIDAEAHRAALTSGCTVAVMGTGWDQIYPRANRSLCDAIVAGGGAVVSEFSAGVPPLRTNFPRRNRIISGLSCGVLVVEAAVRSGSLITARYALEQGREVFAIPGSIHNPQARGCHQLIREGALLVEEASQIVEQLGSLLGLSQMRLSQQESSQPESSQPGSSKRVPQQSLPLESNRSHNTLTETGLTPTQQRVLAALGYDPIPFDRLLTDTGLAVSELNAELMALELSGYLEQGAGVVNRVRD